MEPPYKVLVVTMWFINLKSAVNFRPNDSYAMTAIKNVSQLIISAQSAVTP